MTEQVVDIRDRIEKMRNQMSDDKVSSNEGALSKKSNIQEFSPLQKPSSLKDKNISNQKQNVKPSPNINQQEELKDKKKNLRGKSNKFTSNEPQEEISNNNKSEKPKFEEYPSRVYDDYQNKNTFDQEKKSVKFEETNQPFPQFSLNVSNPISWKLMLLIMLMQLLTNIMLVVVLYLK